MHFSFVQIPLLDSYIGFSYANVALFLNWPLFLQQKATLTIPAPVAFTANPAPFLTELTHPMSNNIYLAFPFCYCNFHLELLFPTIQYSFSKYIIEKNKSPFFTKLPLPEVGHRNVSWASIQSSMRELCCLCWEITCFFARAGAPAYLTAHILITSTSCSDWLLLFLSCHQTLATVLDESQWQLSRTIFSS